jgi:DNA polymerase-3 subunit alpha
MSFVGLHIHSDYSLLDGASQLPQLIDRAVELGMPAIALTDHGVMYGAIELIKVCRNKNVKPIIGNEMYVINGDIEKQERRPKYHQVVLAKNTQGYKNLVKLTTISHLKGFQGKGIFARPCINKDVLEKHKEGLIVTSACLGGEIPQAILRGKLEAAEKVAKWYKDTFGDDFYIEIQDHGQQEDRIVNVELVRIAKKLDIKIIATNDSHFISCYDVEAHDALLCIQTQKLISEDKRLRYTGTEYLKSAEEMAKLFRDHLSDDVIQEAIHNTLEVAEKVEPYNIMGEYRIPNFPIPPEHTADTYVEEKTWEGLRERLKAKTNSEINPEYRERLEYELKMIQRMGFSTYFLVVWDYIRFARENNIPVGPGRGSAAGSLVAYALRITNIDPVHHGLLFERFLNPERKSMPDIDTDFCIERRDEVIKYVTEKYGEDRVAQIITFNRMTSKAVLKDVARVLGIPYGEADRMAKLIPVARGKPEKLKVMISDATPDPEFKKTYETAVYELPETGTKVTARQWLDMAIRIEGTNKTFGVHAAGVVISSDPLDEIVPLQKNNDGAVITQYFMEDLDSLGLLKMDFLGLKNLTMIQRTIDLIQKTQKLKLDPDDFPLNERKIQHILAKGNIKKVPRDIESTYKVLEQGDLEGIFQLESSGMRQVVRDLKPSCIEDISSILALYRPGPLDAGLIPKFIDRKHGREDIIYEHSLLEPILKETYAVLVYQEQIMKVAQDLAGYTLGQADLLRRAMGKKKLSEMQKHRETFIDGATKNGISQKIAENLFEQMVKFAEYCFNKSHSTAYGYVTYQTAYLKANFPMEYMSALLTSNSGDQDKLKKYLVNCTNLGIEVDPPDINRSDVEFTPVDGKILFGLSAIKNLGEGAIEWILEARKKGGPFKSLADLCDRVDLRAVNSRALEALIKCGAFDKLNPNRHQLLEDLKLIISWAQDRAKDRDIGQGNLLDLLGSATATQTAQQSFEQAPSAKPVADFPQKEKLQFEKELLGLYVSDHPLKFAQRVSGKLDPPGITLGQMDEKKGKKVSTIVMLTEIKKITTKKDNRLMAFLKLEDLEGQSEAVVFPDTYEKIKDFLIEETPLILSGKVENRNDQLQLIVDEAKPIKEELEISIVKPAKSAEFVSMLMLELTAQQVTDDKQLKHLKTILEEYTGATNANKIQVIAKVTLGNQSKWVRFGEGFWVQDHQAAVDRLNHDGFVASISPSILLK